MSRFPSDVKHVFHALAFHENRMRFQVNLFESPKGRTPPKQIWFPGSHSDVGGGGKNPDLPRISLLWLLGELQPHITIRNSQILYPEVNHLKPSDAYSESGWKRLVDRYETRLDSKALKARDLIHISLTEIDKANIRPRRAAYHSLMNILELDYLGLQTVALNQVERELSRTRLRTTVQYFFESHRIPKRV
ncbi:hypothetical protein AG1IA_09264 [Rhizoctonia solani AG-1 IA]|uniref:T6SS Phospholipase effector Tle1-like catalytic domain-containing protein n=1 Tax=Thanatephorus cucumeris (strain AG1-IA) TaxID=983506 RepID=L8WIY6_THACA|nr:hypothetical protein AG1IA_09264 [Rhizoctonia solani AG-1 IA]